MSLKEIGVKENDVYHVPSVPASGVLNPPEESSNSAKATPAKSEKAATQQNEHIVLSGLALPKTPAVRSTS